jgi:hypothetical protein
MPQKNNNIDRRKTLHVQRKQIDAPHTRDFKLCGDPLHACAARQVTCVRRGFDVAIRKGTSTMSRTEEQSLRASTKTIYWGKPVQIHQKCKASTGRMHAGILSIISKKNIDNDVSGLSMPTRFFLPQNASPYPGTHRRQQH